tara:strand:+ start:109004 stop:109144 length:141 start_codon:yes stop_codon:yes gene_type:complete
MNSASTGRHQTGIKEVDGMLKEKRPGAGGGDNKNKNARLSRALYQI